MKSIIQMAVGLAVVASVASAEEVAPDAVVYDDYGAVEQSLTGVAGNVETHCRRRPDHC